MLNGGINWTDPFGKLHFILGKWGKREITPSLLRIIKKNQTTWKKPLRPIRLHSCFKNISWRVSTVNTNSILTVVLVARPHYSSLCIALFIWISFRWIFTSELSEFTVPASIIISTRLWFFIHKLQIPALSMIVEFQELSFLLGICPGPTESCTIKRVTINKSRHRNCNPHILPSYLLWKERADSEQKTSRDSLKKWFNLTFLCFYLPFSPSVPPITPRIFLQLN